MATNFVRIGSERQINVAPATDGDQGQPDVIALSSGRFLVAYEDSPLDIVTLQFINVDGTLGTGPLGFGVGQNLALASRGGSTAIVVSETVGSSTPSIRLSLISAEGNNITPGGTTKGVTAGTSEDGKANRSPDVATFANGQSIIAWQTNLSSTDHDIHARVLKADGSDFTTPNRIPLDLNIGASDAPAVAASGNKALIVYEDVRSGGNRDVRAVLFDATNPPSLPPDSIVIANHSANLGNVDVAALKDGRYVVVYQELSATDGNVFARIVSASGSPVGVEIVVANTAAPENSARVAALPDGGFVVTWEKASPGTGIDVFARRYVSDGTPGGDTVRINSATDSAQLLSTVAVNANGRAFVAFHDLGSRPGDNDPSGIRGGAFQAMIEVINGTLGDDTITTYNLGETINGGPGNDTVRSMGGNDIVNAGEGDDLIEGGNGNDNLKGERGSDTVNGGVGNDALNGGQNKGALTGGIGLDSFVFDASVKKGNKQTIADFAPVDDTIVLDATRFKKLDPGPLKGKHFFKGLPDDGNDFVGVRGKKVVYDKNGDGNEGDTVIAVLANDPDGFSKADILVVA